MLKNIIIIIVIVLALALLVSYHIIGNYFYNIALNPNTDKDFVLSTLKSTKEEDVMQAKRIEWLKKISNDVYITSTSNGNLKLHAYEITKDEKSDIWAIVIHGYMDEGSGMTYYAQEFNKRGYNVLMLDLRGHGKSEGNYVGMGWHDRFDVIDWINYIISKNKDSQIMLFGVSMGAATTMMTTGEELPDNVKLAISDCGYTSVWDEFSHQLKLLFNLPDFPVLYAANISCKRKAHYNFKEASSIEQIKKSITPTLFIHGDCDNFVPFEMLEEVYEAANCEKEKLVIQGAGHGKSSTVNNVLYWKTIDEFISKYI